MSRKTLAAVLILASAAVCGCAETPFAGFTPMYATDGIGQKLSRIESQTVQGRTGQFLREDLDDAFAKDRSQPPIYRLNLKLQEQRIPRGLRVDNVANRYELQLIADYTLVDIKARTVLKTGSTLVNLTYDSADQPYAGIAAGLDAQARAADQTAQQLRVALAAFFANPDKPAPQVLPAGMKVDGTMEPGAQAAEAASGKSTSASAQSGIDILGGRMGAQSILSPGERAAGASDDHSVTSTQGP